MRRLHADVLLRNESIRGLQRELHEKVAARDETIRSLQAEMALGVAERDDVIRKLQLALQEVMGTSSHYVDTHELGRGPLHLAPSDA